MSKIDLDVTSGSSTFALYLENEVRNLNLFPVNQTIDFDSMNMREESEYVVTIRYKKCTRLQGQSIFNLNTKLGLKFQPPRNVFEPRKILPRTTNCINHDYLQRIKKGLNIYFNFKWSPNMVIAGEFIFGNVFNGAGISGCHCIDILIYGENTKQTIQDLLTHFNTVIPYYVIKDQDIIIIIPEFDYDIRIIAIPECKSSHEIISNFTIGCYQMYYDGKDVWATRNALYDLVHNTCTFNPTRTQINKVSLYKTLQKNLNIGLSDLVWECFVHCRNNPNDSDHFYKKTNLAPCCDPTEKQILDLNTLSDKFHQMVKNEMTKAYLVRKLYKYAKDTNLIPGIQGYYRSDKVFYNDMKSVLEIVLSPKIESAVSTNEIETLQFMPQYQRNLEDVERLIGTSKYFVNEVSRESFGEFLSTNRTHYEIVMKKCGNLYSNTFEMVPYLDVLLGSGKIIWFEIKDSYIHFAPTSDDLEKLTKFYEMVRTLTEYPMEKIKELVMLRIDVSDPNIMSKLVTCQHNSSVVKLWCKVRIWRDRSERKNGISFELSAIVE